MFLTYHNLVHNTNKQYSTNTTEYLLHETLLIVPHLRELHASFLKDAAPAPALWHNLPPHAGSP